MSEVHDVGGKYRAENLTEDCTAYVNAFPCINYLIFHALFMFRGMYTGFMF